VASTVLIVSAGFGAGPGRVADQISWRLADRGLAIRRLDLIGLRGVSRLGTSTARRLRAAIGPDTVAAISTHPLASQVLGYLRQAGTLAAPVITYLTGMAVHRLWVAPNVDHHLAIHPIAAAQAEGLGAQNVIVTGPVVAPAFQRATPEHKWLARRRFGLPEDERIALVVAGSRSATEIEQTARDIVATRAALPVIACGTNHAARIRLGTSRQMQALDWVDDMPSLLHAADVVVQPGGGMTGFEALASGVPVITYRCGTGHSRLSAAALDEAGWAPWARDQAGLNRLLRCPLVAPAIEAGKDIATAVVTQAGLTMAV
jgi:UDP-N-acetylglucosamine:LPS N-acetylglucosamine transferase